MDDDEPRWTPNRGALFQLEEEAVTAGLQLKEIASTKWKPEIKGGFAAEIMHKTTFNSAAINEGQAARAYSDRDPQFTANGCIRNGHSDLLITDQGRLSEAQVKYHGVPKRTAKSLHQPGPNGQPKYQDQQLVVPSEQLEKVQATARKVRLKESAPGGRAGVASGAAMVEANTCDRISCGPIKSRPLALSEVRDIARDPDGQVRRSIEYPYFDEAIAAVAEEDRVSERQFDPEALLTGDPIDRLIKNGTVPDVLSAMDKDMTVTLEWTFMSTDPDVSFDELDEHEKVRHRMREQASRFASEKP